MSVRIMFETGKVIIQGQLYGHIHDPIDDLMFFLMPYGINEQTNEFYHKGTPLTLTDWQDCRYCNVIDEIHMCYKGTLNRTQRLKVVKDLKCKFLDSALSSIS